jgi:hypothetical protein
MATHGRGGGLHIIFSLFLGLMLATFAGVAVYTFYGPPEGSQDRLQELRREEQAIRETRPPGELPEAEQSRLREISEERDALTEAAAEARKPWSRNTSVILIVFATLTMAVSLVRADELPVISNGLLLGGLFTMLYGVGWIVATDNTFTRFLVMTAALGITLGLGYARFVRGGTGGPSASRPEEGVGGTGDLERRVRTLERRLDGAARALETAGESPVE